MTQERLQKALARMGLGSRRQIEHQIEADQIRINGQQARLGDRVEEGDKINIGTRKVVISSPNSRVRVLLYNKPEGEVCTRKDEQGRPTVFDRISRLQNGRWICVGRLDINSSGLLLFSNHGELANLLMHPSSEIEREYAVRVKGQITPAIIKNLLQGVELEDGKARFERIVDAGGQGSNHWYHVVLREGRNREVRRIWQSQDIQVSRLIRVRYANVSLPRGLKQGKREELSLAEIKALFELVKLEWVERETTHRKPVHGKQVPKGRSAPESVWKKTAKTSRKHKSATSTDSRRKSRHKPG